MGSADLTLDAQCQLLSPRSPNRTGRELRNGSRRLTVVTHSGKGIGPAGTAEAAEDA